MKQDTVFQRRSHWSNQASYYSYIQFGIPYDSQLLWSCHQQVTPSLHQHCCLLKQCYKTHNYTHTCQAGHEFTPWPLVPLGQGTPEKIQSEVGPQVTSCVARCCSPDRAQGASIMQSATQQGESNPPLTIILKVRLLKASHKQQFLRSKITASLILFQDHWLRMSHISSFGR